MGCRSWPLCNGHLGLSGTIHALLEQSHRYGAAIVTVLVVASFAVVFRSRERDPVARRSAAAALGLIVVQVALGAITVLAHNAGWTVAVHLAGAWLLVAAVTVTASRALRRTEPATGPVSASATTAGTRPRAGGTRQRWRSGRTPALTAAVAVFMLGVSGMLVLHEGASLACPSWPLCTGSSASPGLVLLQYVHRSLGLIATVAVGWAAVVLWRSSPRRSRRRTVAAAVLTALAATAAMGGLVATTGASELTQDVHLALASALWLGTVMMASVTPPAAVARGAANAEAAPHGAFPATGHA